MERPSLFSRGMYYCRCRGNKRVSSHYPKTSGHGAQKRSRTRRDHHPSAQANRVRDKDKPGQYPHCAQRFYEDHFPGFWHFEDHNRKRKRENTRTEPAHKSLTEAVRYSATMIIRKMAPANAPKLKKDWDHSQGFAPVRVVFFEGLIGPGGFV